MVDSLLVNRRDFLRIAALSTSALILGACSGKVITSTETAIIPSPSPSNEIINAIVPTNVPTNRIIRAIIPDMVLVAPGSFLMGSDDGYPNEQPIHPVEISKPFYIGKYAVTFEEYDLFCEDTSLSKPDDRGWGRGSLPVIHVDFNNAAAYCNWLSLKEGLTACYSGKAKNMQCDFSANGYRLPTEAEWEYAARGGQKSNGTIYAGSNNPDLIGWFDENADGQPHPVGQKLPNELDLYDMSGNLYEWCWDWYDKNYYVDSPEIDPQGPPPPQVTTPWDLTRVRRSGSWREKSESIRIAFRSYDAINYPGDNGFRVVRTA